MNLNGKNVAILGLGIEGIALFDFLKDKVGSITLCDQNIESELLEKAEPDSKEKLATILKDESVKKNLGPNYLGGLDSFDIVFRSPSIYFNDPNLVSARKRGTIISSQMKLFFDLCPSTIVGVTGTKGKGTTSSIIYAVLKDYFADKDEKVYLAGNIGYPAVTLIPELTKKDVVILELSNFQLADLDKSPHVAVITNLGVDHLDYHKNEEEYRLTKENIVKYQSEKDVAILNFNSTINSDVISKIKSKLRYFSKDNPYLDASVVLIGDKLNVVLDPKGRNLVVCQQGDINLLGKHNLENIAAASLALDALDVPIEIIRKGVANFVGLPHRLELVRQIAGIKFINDSFATNPGPTMAAIDSFDEDKVLILGGSSKGSDFNELANVISESNVKSVIIIGQEAEKIKKALKVSSYSGRVVSGGSNILEIVKNAREEAKRGDIVIFSPACASFDMFKNYKDRGNKFKEAVMGLK
jgi:UDP-N-acetylmuramoylalanine--D-glutamate ligase